jgi:hypothetical protein
MTMNLPMAFIALRNLLNRPCLRAFYSGITDEVEAYYRVSHLTDRYANPVANRLQWNPLDFRKPARRAVSKNLRQL